MNKNPRAILFRCTTKSTCKRNIRQESPLIATHNVVTLNTSLPLVINPEPQQSASLRVAISSNHQQDTNTQETSPSNGNRHSDALAASAVVSPDACDIALPVSSIPKRKECIDETKHDPNPVVILQPRRIVPVQRAPREIPVISLNTHDHDGKWYDEYVKWARQFRPVANANTVIEEIKEAYEKDVSADKSYKFADWNRFMRGLSHLTRNVYDPLNKVWTHDILLRLWPAIKQDHIGAQERALLYEQIADILNGPCAQGQTTRLFACTCLCK